MSSDRIERSLPTIISQPYETRSVEYKRSGSLTAYERKLARTALAMANLRDGGLIVVGVATIQEALQPLGMTDEDWSTYNQDDVQEKLTSYMSQPVEVNVAKPEIEGKRFVVIEIGMFRRTPVFAVKAVRAEDDDSIVKHCFYYRPFGGKPQTRIVTPQDLSDIMELAGEVRLRAFVESAERSNIHLTTQPPTPATDPYDEELGGF